MQMVTDCSDDAAELDRVENADKFPAQQRGFANALDVCVRTYQQGYPLSMIRCLSTFPDYERTT